MPLPRTRKRGDAASTHERLLQAAAEAFDREGFHGTDSNRIALQAGYATGTFYKHFADKRAAFLEVLERQAAAEVETLREALAAPRSPEIASSLVARVLELRQHFRGLRASARLLGVNDPEVRAASQRHRAEMVDLLGGLRGNASREADALLLWVLERAGDALANGEVRDVHLSRTSLVAELERAVDRRLRAR